jgi:signal transduction histidine kinase
LELAVAEGHIGLASIRERVDAVGGTFVICRRVPRGTACRVTVPTGDGIAPAAEGNRPTTCLPRTQPVG